MDWRCVLERFLPAAAIVLAIAVIVDIVWCAFFAAPTAELGFLPCLLAMAPLLAPFVVASLAAAFSAAMALCSGGSITPIDPTATSALTAEGGEDALPPGFGKGMDCEAAQAALAEALRELRDAREALRDAVAATRRARRRLNRAVVAAGISLGAIVGGILNPAALVGAIFASAAALALVARRGRALARAAQREFAARAALATIEAKVAALQALVNALCPRVGFTPIDDDDDDIPGGITPVDGTPSVIT